MAKAPAPRCYVVIDGPKYGRIVAWRKPCRNRTRHPSGRCRFHRRDGCWVGETRDQHVFHRQREVDT